MGDSGFQADVSSAALNDGRCTVVDCAVIVHRECVGLDRIFEAKVLTRFDLLQWATTCIIAVACDLHYV